ncbi:tripartite tricarboxylate transporter permease [Thermococcus stetteri]|uniref:tripartite tricarboxylate transporter permease n=1 Tax=Thermococcus stetteri TaxID=49900 RepID=UPI001AE454C8|nr:tripartite tricarboxylate transporter permease [Thermococcus stetteri]MBP1911601.1 putative membrane protein [Thermococcus stetteri]
MLRELLLGVLFGTFTGLTPGIHVNTLAVLLNEVLLPPLTLFSMGLTHTYLDAFPSTFLGVPDEGTALGILPAHRLVLAGKGMEVVRIALYSSFLATLLFIPLIPLYLVIATMYTSKVGKTAVLLLILLLVFTEKGMKKLWAAFIVILSSLVGFVILGLPLTEPLYHLLTGLFGVPVILAALFYETSKVSPGSAELEMSIRRLLSFSFLGTLLGMVASLVPAFTSSQAALIGSFFSRDERSFLTVVYSTNTANFLFSLVNFLETGRARNGIVMRMPPMGLSALPVFLLASLFVGILVMLYAESVSKMLASSIFKIPYKAINLGVLVSLLILSVYFDGIAGALALAASSIVGLLAVLLGVRRTNCMGALMVPILVG